MTARALALSLAVLLAGGCVPRARGFAPAGGFYSYAPGFAVELPAGWLRTPRDAGLTATRDGLLLQRIWVDTEPLSPAALGKGLATALPEEDAAQLVDRLEATAGWKVREVRPAFLSGAPGYRILASFRDADGLAYGTVVVGAVVGRSRWLVGYAAPSRHYFDLDLPAFERAVASFRVVAPER